MAASFERGVEPLRPFAGSAGAAFAGGLVIAGALAGPARRGARPWGTRSCRCRSQRSSARRCAAAPRIVQSSLTAGQKGRICSSTASESRSICSSRKSRCARIAPSSSACSGSNRPSSASLSAGIFLRSLPRGELGEQLGIGRPGDQRVEHRPAGLAEDVGRDAVELDPGLLERLVQPLRLALALGDLRTPIARQLAQITDRLGRDKARPAAGPPRQADTATRRQTRRSCAPEPA